MKTNQTVKVTYIFPAERRPYLNCSVCKQKSDHNFMICTKCPEQDVIYCVNCHRNIGVTIEKPTRPGDWDDWYEWTYTCPLCFVKYNTRRY